MPYEPKHGLSELLRRRHASLMHRMARNPNRDQVIACTEEMLSIEYWMRIAQEAEREQRMDRLSLLLIQELNDYEEEVMNLIARPR